MMLLPSLAFCVFLSLSPRPSLADFDGQCSQASPCPNGACCSKSGYCGYGPDFCGSSCISNCGAVAECGQYASPAGKKCPLNVCCSQYGFCGTTADFCNAKCQSNCVLSPKPPASSSSSVLSRVVGYYESWNADLACHAVAPEHLALDALTHVNFAFAYLDASFNVVTMGGSSSSTLMLQTTNVKTIKPDIRVFISIGGWSFSDNGTSTQPLFAAIASSATNRQTFANNLVDFMRQYAFDGVDLDWEYPGAPDRGGHPEDPYNYVLLLQTLRQTFDASGSQFGVTFTVPSSYWYLRWFDLPSMLQYADWINLMTYDLHGVWDSTDPIGSIVQAHTNLTEIKLAAQLLWRVNVPPDKVTMGFGFYGRSFTLASPSCTVPGCPFSGAARAGPCTNTGGILSYYEIMSVLKGPNPPTPMWDHDAAVKYISWASDQWVSYDDTDTFKQKVSWANSVGIGGSMIWASDQDDTKYSAHSALLGRAVQSTADLAGLDKAQSNMKALSQAYATNTGQNCFQYDKKCINLNDNKAMNLACGPGSTVVGWDDAGCGTKKCHCGKPICCPTSSAPKGCKWRGNDNGRGAAKTDCTAQCAVGELNIRGIRSSWGGGFTNDGNTNKCGRGYKVFCCPDPLYESAAQACFWTKKFGETCPLGDESVLQKAGSTLGTGNNKHLCCPIPSSLSACHWVSGSLGQGGDPRYGESDCVNAVCPKDEVEVDRDAIGDSLVSCSWGRKQAACCKIVGSSPPPPAMCSVDLCKTFPGACSNDPNNDEEADDYTLRRRSIGSQFNDSIHYLDLVDLEYNLEKRRPPLTYWPKLMNAAGKIITKALPLTPPAYPSNGRMTSNADFFFRLTQGTCAASTLIEAAAYYKKAGTQSEHVLERQVIKMFLESASSGVLKSGATVGYRFPLEFLQGFWNTKSEAISRLPPFNDIAKLADLATPNDRVFHVLGSNLNPDVMFKLEKQVNGVKGRLFSLHQPWDLDVFEAAAQEFARLPNKANLDTMLQLLRTVFGAFDYMHQREIALTFLAAGTGVLSQLRAIESVWGGAASGFSAFWHAFMLDYADYVALKGRLWMGNALTIATREVSIALAAGARGQDLTHLLSAYFTIATFRSRARGLSLPPPLRG